MPSMTPFDPRLWQRQEPPSAVLSHNYRFRDVSAAKQHSPAIGMHLADRKRKRTKPRIIILEQVLIWCIANIELSATPVNVWSFNHQSGPSCHDTQTRAWRSASPSGLNHAAKVGY